MTHHCPKCGYSDDRYIYVVKYENNNNNTVYQVCKAHRTALKHQERGEKIYRIETSKLVEYKIEKA